jgi:hypothetical protein
MTGIGVVLIPGIGVKIRDIQKNKTWEKFAPVIWVLGYIGLYAWRLPVTYQHGRYIIPAMPIGFIFGLAGLFMTIDFVSKISWKRIISKVWTGVSILVLIIFWIRGANAFALDVGVIETEMVQVAKWIEKNTDPDAVIAAHDIGALGYYSTRFIVDLAGLITPDVIPFIRNEEKLKQYLELEEVDYLVSFPGWYPALTKGLTPIYSSESDFSAYFENENMVIYIWE